MRIGLLVDSLIGGGAERVVANLAAEFGARGHEVHIILVRREIEMQVGPEHGKVHALSEDGRLHPLRPVNKWLLARRLRRLVEGLEADGTRFAFFLSNADDSDRLALMARLRNSYLVCHNSVLATLLGKSRHRRRWKAALRRWRWMRHLHRLYDGRCVITVSKALAEEITGPVGLRPSSIATIYNPFNFDEIRRLAAAPAAVPREPYAICVARFQNRKRQDVLLRAFARVDELPRLVLLGGTYTESDRRWLASLEALAAELGIRDRVVFPGFQKNPFPWIRGARLSVLASDGEGLGNVLVESLVLRVPTVSTDCPHGPAEVLTGPLARFLARPGDPADLARAMREALAAYPAVDDVQLARFRTGADQYLEHCAPRS